MNVSIKEGNENKIFGSVDYLKTKLYAGGTTDWVPEEERRLTSKWISKNGTYLAQEEKDYNGNPYYGFDVVDVDILEDELYGYLDGDFGLLSLENGLFKFSDLPTSIQVDTPPTKTTYSYGEDIDFTGLVVKAYRENGTLWTSEKYPDGVVPFSELLPSQTQAKFPEKFRYVEFKGQKYYYRKGVDVMSWNFSLAYKWSYTSNNRRKNEELDLSIDEVLSVDPDYFYVIFMTFKEGAKEFEPYLLFFKKRSQDDTSAHETTTESNTEISGTNGCYTPARSEDYEYSLNHEAYPERVLIEGQYVYYIQSGHVFRTTGIHTTSDYKLPSVKVEQSPELYKEPVIDYENHSSSFDSTLKTSPPIESTDEPYLIAAILADAEQPTLKIKLYWQRPVDGHVLETEFGINIESAPNGENNTGNTEDSGENEGGSEGEHEGGGGGHAF